MRKQVVLASLVVGIATQAGCTPKLAGLKIDPSAKTEQRCTRGAPCIVPVNVVTETDQLCEVQVPIKTVFIVQGQTNVKVVWSIVDPPPPPKFDYQFHPTKGIEISGNNTATDFDQGGPDGGPRRYMWNSKNLRKPPQPFDYVVSVQRKPKGQPHSEWLPCTLLDPQMVNEGQ